jgi:hypothetical protein
LLIGENSGSTIRIKVNKGRWFPTFPPRKKPVKIIFELQRLANRGEESKKLMVKC